MNAKGGGGGGGKAKKKEKHSHTHCSLSPFHASAPRTHELMLLKAWHKIYGRLEIGEGGREGEREGRRKRRERRAGSGRLTPPAVPRCGTAGAAPPAAGCGGGG